MTKNKKRTFLTVDEKIQKALNALFILHAVQLKMKNADMRKILGVAMRDINGPAKAVNKALKKMHKEQQ